MCSEFCYQQCTAVPVPKLGQDRVNVKSQIILFLKLDSPLDTVPPFIQLLEFLGVWISFWLQTT